MPDWIPRACDEVDRIVSKDAYYQELNEDRLSLEEEYTRILSRLSPEDHEILVSHVYTLTEMEYQKTQAAYRLGKRTARR